MLDDFSREDDDPSESEDDDPSESEGDDLSESEGDDLSESEGDDLSESEVAKEKFEILGRYLRKMLIIDAKDRPDTKELLKDEWVQE